MTVSMTTNKKVNKIAVVQTGGCSAVINSTLAGIVENAKASGLTIYGLLNGFEGLLNNKIIDLSVLTKEQIDKLRNTPAMFLGSSRMFLTKEIFKAIPQKLNELGIDALIMIGGNGTMYAAKVIHQSAVEQNIDLVVVGSPKTVDNDMFGIEYSPGFGSAAKYIAQLVRDISVDLESMKTFEQVRIIEVMGRSVGWLAAASMLAKRSEKGAPHLIYLPEHDFNEAEFVEDVKKVYEENGFVVAVIGEGIHDSEGNPVGSNPFADVKQASKIYGGASTYLASLISEKLNLKARAQDLTMAQRCFGALRSDIDEQKAYKIGFVTIEALKDNHDNEMICLADNNEDYYTIALEDVGGKEKKVPDDFYDAKNKQMTKDFKEWIMPIIGNFDDKYLSDKDNLYFYLTFQNPLNPNKQISIFTPDFDIALEYNTYPDCKLLLVEHELSSQSKSDRYKHPEIDEIYSINEMSTEKDMPEKNCAIKFGGNVMPIQWGLDNDGKVVKDGNSFIFQINEICMKDISVFMAGCIYVYGKIEGNKVTNPFVAYWEYS